MQKVEAYQATDGELFTSAESCQEHETSLLWRDRLEEFQSSKFCPYPSGAQAGMLRKIVIGWERFKAENPKSSIESALVDALSM
jgi:hypothetical protein